MTVNPPDVTLMISFFFSQVTLLRHLTMAELQRMKRQFVAFTKTHPVETAKIANTFVQYINNSIN